MTRITVNADCGHSPKKALLKDLNIAFARAEGKTAARLGIRRDPAFQTQRRTPRRPGAEMLLARLAELGAS